MTSPATSRPALPRNESFLFALCVAIVLAPLAFRGTSCGQDFDFHLESWMGAAQHWHSGILYPHWFAAANYGAGEPRFVFYPPLTWMLGALLGTILPWTWTPIAFTLVCLIAAGAACYRMAREWLPANEAALAASLYITNPYLLFVIYERGACGELLAAAWLPLLILYALRKRSSVLQLALVIALLWLTNDPAAAMGCYALGVLALVTAITRRSFQPILRAASSLALGLGLACIYLIPAIYEQRWVEINRALMPGMRPQDSFLFAHTGLPYHDLVLRTASWIAAYLLVGTTIAFLPAWRDRNLQPLRAKFLTLAGLIAFLQFPVSRFLWNIAPKLRYLQFPWRWLAVLDIIFALVLAVALVNLSQFRTPLPSRTKTLLLPYTAVFFLAVFFTAHAWHHFWLVCDDEDNIHAQIATMQQEGFQGTDEYTPAPADNGDIQQDLPPIRIVYTADGDQADIPIAPNPEYQPDNEDLIPAAINIQRWQPEHITATVQSPQAGYAILRLMDYPAWQVTIHNQSTSRPKGGPQKQAEEWREARMPGRPVRFDGLIVVPIAAGTSTINVHYTTTPDAWAGRILSLLSLIVWIVLTANSRRRRFMIERNAS